MLIAAVLTLSWLSLATQETEPKNSEICDQNNNADKDIHQCRENLAGGLQCRDNTKCRFQTTCSDHDAAVRAGMLCNGAPWYNGGYPLSPITWDSEVEDYTCLKVSNSTEYCAMWETLEDGADEYELGTCTCIRESRTIEANRTYCAEWTCRQRETDKCKAGEVGRPEQNRPTRCCFSCEDENDNFRSASECYCFYTPHSELEFSEASCTNFTGKFCSEWHQEEFDETNAAFREFEDYKCTRSSSNGLYCQSWVGDIESEEEFEVTDCSCNTDNSGDQFCPAWRCFEQGQDYFYPNLLWSLLTLIIGIFPGLGIIITGVTDENNTLVFCGSIAMLIWGGGFTILGIWLGGMGVFFIQLAIFYGILTPLVILSRAKEAKNDSFSCCDF